jgi:hypothetical protein
MRAGPRAGGAACGALRLGRWSSPLPDRGGLQRGRSNYGYLERGLDSDWLSAHGPQRVLHGRDHNLEHADACICL